MRNVARSLTAAVALVALGAAAGVGMVAAQGEWKAPPEAKNLKNPLAGQKTDPKILAEGKKLADTNCVTCHGPDGKGNGPAAAALPPPKPADWTSARVKGETDGEIFWKISNGRGAMPPWKHLPEKDRWTLVNYI